MKIKLSLIILFVVAFASACSGFDPQEYVPGLYTPTPVLLVVQETPSPVQPTPTEAVLTPTKAATKTVCTNIPGGRLNVRFAPGENNDVRGYLTESETVTLDGASKDLNGTVWVKLSHPIEGWVNSYYLCEEDNG